MSTRPESQYSKKRRKNTLSMFYVFVLLATGTFIMAVKARQPAQVALFVLGIVLAGGGIWSFLRFSLLQSASCNDSGSFPGPRSWYPH